MIKINDGNSKILRNERETITKEKLVLSNSYQLEVLINVLEKKSILTGKEVLDELEVIVATKGERS